MKRKCLIIVGLILAILTIGAASASEDVSSDDISASDEGADIKEVPLEEAPQTDEVIESNQDDSLGSVEADEIGDPDERANSTHRVEIPEDVRMGSDGQEEDMRFDFVAVVFEDDDIGGTVSILVDGDEKYNETVISGVQDKYGANRLRLSNLELPAGIHNVTVKYSGDDNYLPFEENCTFELYYFMVSVPEELLISEDTFKLIFAVDATGYADVYIDDKKKETYDVYDVRYDDEEGVYTRIYVDVEDCSFGPHTYRVEYYGGNYGDKNISGSFNLSYVFEVYCYDDTYGKPLEFDFYLPYDALGNITLAFNNKTYQIESEGYHTVYYFNEAEPGENNFTFTYEDSTYPEKTVNITVDVRTAINLENYDGEISYNSDKNNLTLILPSNANGNLSVYRKTNYNYETDEYELILISTVPLQDGRASVSVSNLGLGNFEIVAKYTGEDYDVKDSDFDIRIKPNLYPQEVWIENLNSTVITVEVPEINGSTMIIGFVTYDYEIWEDVITCELYNGSFKSQSISLPEGLNLAAESYQIMVIQKYGEEEWERNSWTYQFIVNEYGPDLDVEFMVPQEVSKLCEVYYYGYGLTSEYRFIPKNIPRNYEGIISYYIDGKLMESRHYADLYEGAYDLTGLDIGNHTWKITLTDDSYYNDISLNGSFEVIWYKMPETVIIGVDGVALEFNDDATGYVSLKIDGKDYAMEFLEGGGVQIDLDDISPGMHTYEIMYSGDADHEKFNRSGSFNAVVDLFFINMDYDMTYPYSNPFVIRIGTADDATGNITINVDGANYTQMIVKGEVRFEIPLEIGKHAIVAKYLGDDKYDPCEISNTFTIYGYEFIFDFDDYYEDLITSVLLSLPSDAAGNMTLYSWNYDIDDRPQKGEKIISIPLVNGSAFYSFKDNFKVGSGKIFVGYDGDDYEVSSQYLSDVFSKPIINVSENLVMGENGTVEINVGNATGSIDIYINDEIFKTEELVNGKINVTIPASKFELGENIITFDYIGGDIDTNIFGYYDFEYEKYVPFEYYVYVEPLNFVIPSEFSADGSGNITIELPEGSSGNVTVYVDDINVSTTPVTAGVTNITVSGLKQGYTRVRAVYEDDNGRSSEVSCKVYVPKPEAEMNITIPASSETPEFTVNLPSDATGTLIVNIGGNNYGKDLEKGKATISVQGLADGTYEVMVKYTGDENYSGFTKYVNVTVNTGKGPVDPKLNILPIGDVEKGKDVTIYITADETFSGTVNVQVGKMNTTATLTNGHGNVTVTTDLLDVGETLVKVTSAANENFTAGEFSIRFNITSNGDGGSNLVAEDLVAYYNKVSYSVTVYGTDGKVASDVVVTFKVNGKKVGTAKTNAKGVATIRLAQLPNTYKITSSALGKSVTKKLTVKRVLSLNKIKIKKSTKKVVIKATLKEGKKAIKGKVTFIVKGKKVNIKKTVTVKKGVAKLTLKKSVVKKLKKGKSVTYQATYVKDTVKKKVKIKK